jgi:hypothetical protein
MGMLRATHSASAVLAGLFAGVWADISYRDDWEDDSGYHCKLRVAVDTVISTGYSHFDTDQPSSDPDIDWLNPNSWPNSDRAI